MKKIIIVILAVILALSNIKGVEPLPPRLG
jgi:hypothetical protein